MTLLARASGRTPSEGPRVLTSAGITAVCAAVAVAAVGATVAAAVRDGTRSFTQPVPFVVVLLLLIYTHVRPTRLVHRHGSVESDHLDEALFVPMALLLSPFDVAVAVGVAALAGNLATRRAPVKVVFNVGQTVLACLAGYAVARSGGAGADAPISTGVILACCAGGIVFATTSSIAVAGVVRLAAGHPLFAGLWEQWRTRGIASIGALLLGVVAGVAIHDHPITAVPAIALGWTVERAYVAIVVQRQARHAAETLQQAVIAVRNSSDPDEVRAQVLAAAASVLQARTTAFVDPAAPTPPGALRSRFDEDKALQVADRVGGGAWLDSERDALNTLATVGGAALRNARLLAHLTAITDGQSEGVLAIDATGVVTFANPAARRLLAHPDDLVGRVAEEVFTIERASGRLDLAVLSGSDEGIRDDEAMLCAGATRVPVAFTAAGLPAPQTGVVVVLRDIVERKAFEEKLAYLAFHDPLTDLPNRRLFEDRLDHALIRAQRYTARHALLVVDLDRFKLVNDSYGHPAGDRLLVQVATRLRRLLSLEDTCARFGGDAFAILVEDIRDDAQPTSLAERIVAELGTGYVIEGHEVFVSASVGVATSDQAPSREALIAAAHVAAHGAKNAGNGSYQVFAPSTAGDPRARFELEAALRRALEHREFELHYQPVVDTRSGEVVGAEALVRWNSADGLVPPFTFIPLAEETGLIVPIGAWVLEEACRQGRAWTAGHPDRRPLKISVNLSAHQLSRPAIVREVRAILESTGFCPEQLCLEITETAILTDAESMITTLRELKGLGVQVAIDDFGTGYSSLSYLKRFPIDVVKVDQTFTSGLGENAVDSEIVAAVIRMASAAAITVVAEGVERDVQRDALDELGCPLIQGFLISEPLTRTDFASFWATSPTALDPAGGHSSRPRIDDARLPATPPADGGVRQVR